MNGSERYAGPPGPTPAAPASRQDAGEGADALLALGATAGALTQFEHALLTAHPGSAPPSTWNASAPPCHALCGPLLERPTERAHAMARRLKGSTRKV
ncbi:hypothetical protein OG828_48320 [Streptomyces sp. NBC_00457]|uniref:hypothetical protein n=1 Tax=Streptomyces sp. NBC_00457 TaxID=2975748 RepID=UPI002E1FE1C8